mmetsp:Transcript_13083/g.18735  ORF Transcript_13083/g.18735 Transcript_13083/m.18735 type:complete len:289 (+) Transcript_13083:95-961(+)
MCKEGPNNAAPTRQQQIDLLNARVQKITKKAIHEAKEAEEPLALEFVHAQKQMTILTAGFPIYQRRSALLVYMYAIGASCLIIRGALMIHPLTTALCVITMLFGYDFYSGILHVVFDHPDNIAVPILGQPCLEFQWHHAIPYDIVQKDFVDVCGDLNVAIMILIPIYCTMLDLDNGVAMVIGGLKLWMAYFGQFSHKSAHMYGNGNTLATWLQNHGLMISTKEHTAHHKPPHDIDFCLIGVCNPLIDALRTLTTNNRIWVSLFFIWSIFDLACYVRVVGTLAQFLQIS